METELPDVDHLIALAAEDPIAAKIECGQALGSLHLVSNRYKHVILAGIYGCAYTLERDEQKWRAFIALGLWRAKGRRRPRREKDRDKRLRLAFVAACATSGSSYDRAHTYTRALQKFYDRGEKPSNIAHLIEAGGGIESLYRKSIEEAKRERECKCNCDYLNDFIDPDDSGQTEEGAGRGAGTRRRSKVQLEAQIVALVGQLECNLVRWARNQHS